MNERLRKLRKTLDLTQQDFGNAIGVKGNTVAQWESGRNAPPDTAIMSICREFNVNEKWFRTGEGKMFVEMSPDEEIAKFVGEVMAQEDESFKKRLISGLAALDENGWKVLEDFLNLIKKGG